MAARGAASTGNPANIAIQRTGFPRVARANVNGNSPVFDATPYTRAGDLTCNAPADPTTQTGQLVLGYGATQNSNGSYPINAAGGPNNPIIVRPGSSLVAIGRDGSANSQTPAGANVTAGYTSRATFLNPAGLQRQDGSLWTTSSASGPENGGQPGTGTIGQTISGELERSNVTPRHRVHQRDRSRTGLPGNGSTITTAGQMMQTAIQMKQQSNLDAPHARTAPVIEARRRRSDEKTARTTNG